MQLTKPFPLRKFLIGACLLPPLHAQETLYVDAGAPNGGDGSSWNTAFQDLQDALDTAAMDPQVQGIHLAEGTYRPDRGSLDPALTFTMVDGIALLGGFPSGGSDLAARDSAAHPSVLTGDLLGDDSPLGPTGSIAGSLDNSETVMRMANLSGATLLDGVEIRGGAADGFADQFGGGIIVEGGSPRIVHCRFVGNSALRSGGGLALVNSAATVELCTFRENTSGAMGGGLWVGGHVAASVMHCNFERNAGNQGAGLGVSPLTFSDPNGSSTTVLDCRFVDNQAVVGSSNGGGAYLRRGPVTMKRCHFLENWAQGGGGLYIDMGHAFVSQCWFERNEAGGDGGGAIAITNFTNGSVETTRITSSLMIGNTGVATVVQSDVEFINCTLADNGATGSVQPAQWPAVVNQASEVHFFNSIIWGHIPFGSFGDERDHFLGPFQNGSYGFQNCIIEGWAGALPGNALNLNPLFKDPVGPDGNPQTVADNDYGLQDSSPAVDGGLSAWLSPGAIADVVGQARIRDGDGDGAIVVDVGAYELAMPHTIGQSFCGPAPRGSNGLSGSLFALGSDIVTHNQVTLRAEFLPPNH
ncbi:MAG: right-handed parallel beta-helix repeat-containing protein, partial [Planctomycetota bacterium]|nr:right-handed parallel beta-helix repeat-containing protein [Planctomycetota bacterium]